MANRDDLAALEAENIRLIALLEAHGIEVEPIECGAKHDPRARLRYGEDATV